MKKKAVTAPPPLLEGFTTETLPSTTPISATPSGATPIQEPITNNPELPTVPSIDLDAALKIESVETTEGELPQEEKRGKLFFVLGSILGLLVIFGAVILGIFLFRSPTSQATAPQTTPTPQPTQTPVPILKNADITFEVLNATKTSGLAAKYGKRLEVKGYKVSSLGNSEESVTGLAVYIASQLESQKDTLMIDLKKEFPEATYSGTLTESSNLVRLIIGN